MELPLSNADGLAESHATLAGQPVEQIAALAGLVVIPEAALAPGKPE